MPLWNTVKKFVLSLGGYAKNQILPAVILLVIGILVVRIITRLIASALKKTKMDGALIKLAQRGLRVVLYVLLLLMVASRLGIDVTGVVALASVLTLAISLSVQSALTNVIGGFTLLNTKPFVPGDFVEIAGQSGTVRDVGLTYTKLSTADNKTVSIPNSAVVAAEIVNYSTAGTRRVEVALSVSYESDPEKVMAALYQAADLPEVLQDPAPKAGIRNYGESAVEYVLFVWCESSRYWDVLFAINERVKTVFAENDVSFTYPHVHVHMEK